MTDIYIPIANLKNTPKPNEVTGQKVSPRKDLGFLFVAPKLSKAKQAHPFPYGISYVAAMLKREGFRVSCLDLSFSDEPVEDQLRDKITRESVDVVCTGGMSIDYHAINQVLQVTRKINPELITVVGGAMVTCDPELAIEVLEMDYGVISEGEYIMADLAKALCTGEEPGDIVGLVLRDSTGQIKKTGTRKSTRTPDDLPLPDYEGFEFGRHLEFMTPNRTGYHMLETVREAQIRTARSCPFPCTFCYQALGRIYSQRSLDNVFDEIDYLIKNYQINCLSVNDDLFSVDKEWLLAFANRIKPYGILWVSQFRVRDVDYEMMLTLRDSGLIRISYGIESVNDKILLSMQKKIKVKDIEFGLSETRRAKIGITGNLLFGDPAETLETFDVSLKWWRKNLHYDLALFPLLTIPDAPVYRDALARGLIKDKVEFLKQGFPLINLTQIPDRQFNAMIGKMAAYTVRYKTRGRVIQSRKTGVVNDSNRYEIIVQCPECNETSTYRNFEQDGVSIISGVYCQHCQRRFYIDTVRAFPDNFTLVSELKFRFSHLLSSVYQQVSILRYFVQKSPRIYTAVKRIKGYLTKKSSPKILTTAKEANFCQR